MRNNYQKSLFDELETGRIIRYGRGQGASLAAKNWDNAQRVPAWEIVDLLSHAVDCKKQRNLREEIIEFTLFDVPEAWRCKTL
jgi:hypothetical protein